ncbi:MAG: FHA domain-containing protein [Pseudomonadota bacterium]
MTSDHPEQPGGSLPAEAESPRSTEPAPAAAAAGGPTLGAPLPPEPRTDPHGFEHRPPVTIDMPAPSFEETRVTEAVVHKRRIKRQIQRARAQAYVIVHRAGVAPARVPMERDHLVFGRDPAECDIVLDGGVVSRSHARIDRSQDGYYTLQDCKSRNGTYVEGVPIRRRNLLDGDTFEVGEHLIEFHLGES